MRGERGYSPLAHPRFRDTGELRMCRCDRVVPACTGAVYPLFDYRDFLGTSELRLAERRSIEDFFDIKAG